MILTVTMNPAIDISYPLETLAIDTTNRVDNERKSAGGKGLNVTRVLHLLGKEVVATGLIGGAIGQFIMNDLINESIQHRFYTTDQESRICIAMLHDHGKQTELLEGGPTFDSNVQAHFLAYFKELLSQLDVSVLTISGSLPQGLTNQLYSQMIALADEQKIQVVLDCSGETLKESIKGKHKPTVIKPNQEELAALLKVPPLTSQEMVLAALKSPLLTDIPLVLVSLGSQGAIAKAGATYYKVEVPRIKAVSPVGSGDATVAGLAAGLAVGASLEEQLRMAMTTGVLNTLESRTGFINVANYEKYFQQIKLTKL